MDYFNFFQSLKEALQELLLYSFTYEILNVNNCFRLLIGPLIPKTSDIQSSYQVAEHKMAHVQVYPWKACFFSYATSRSIFKLKPSPKVRVILFLITHTHTLQIKCCYCSETHT